MKEDLKELAELQKSLKVEIEEPKFDMMSILNDVNLDLLEQEMREDIKNQCAMLNIHPGKQARSAFFSSRIQRSIQYLDKRQNENLSPFLSVSTNDEKNQKNHEIVRILELKIH